MKSCYIGIFMILIGYRSIAQVDTSNYIYKHSFQDHLLQTKVTDSTTTNWKADINIRICVPSKSQILNPTLFVIKSHNQTFCFMDTGSAKLSSINPQWIKKIDILKNSDALNIYGKNAKNGVIEITIDDDMYPEALKSIQQTIKKNSHKSI